MMTENYANKVLQWDQINRNWLTPDAENTMDIWQKKGHTVLQEKIELSLCSLHTKPYIHI